MIRLSKYLSLCGVTSRRGAEALIAEGRITLNNRKVDRVGVVINEAADVVTVDGTVVVPVAEKVYIVLNKPQGVMTTLHDPFKRKTVLHYLRELQHRVYPVGRLDLDTEGVLLLCNDGDLAFRLAHPRFQVEKTYEAVVGGLFKRGDSMRIQHGIKLEDGAVGRARVDVMGYGENVSHLRLTLTEGRKREVKQLCRAVGHPVRQLRRVEFAGIDVRDLPLGAWRHLTGTEVRKLKSQVGL